MITILSDNTRSSVNFRIIENQIEKHFSSDKFTEFYVSHFGRQVDDVIAHKLHSLGKSVVCCHSNKVSKTKIWKSLSCFSKLKVYRTHPGEKLVPSVYIPMIQMYRFPMLSFWTGDTISNDINSSLKVAEKLEIKMITHIIEKG